MPANILKKMMGDTTWESIDIMRVSRACSAQLEDRIEETLRAIQDQQSPKEFDIRGASLDVQMTLAAYIKRLCLRRERANDAWKYFHSMQSVLTWELKDGLAPSVYRHPANRVERKETMSVSVERDELPAVPEQQGPVRRVRRAPRQPRRGDTGSIR